MTCTGLCRLVGVAIDRVIDAATDATDAAGAQRARGRVVSSAASWRRPRQICRLCSRHGSCGLVNLIPSCMTPLRTVATPPALAPEATALAAYHLLEVPVAGADNSGRLLGASAAFAAATGATSAAMQDRPVAEWLGLQAPSAARPCKNAPAAPAVPAEAAAALALAARLGSNEPLAPQPRFGHRGGGHSLQDWLGQRRSGAPPPAVGPIDLGARGRHADGQWHYLLTRRVPRAACRVPRAAPQCPGRVGRPCRRGTRFERPIRPAAARAGADSAVGNGHLGSGREGVERAAVRPAAVARGRAEARTARQGARRIAALAARQPAAPGAPRRPRPHWQQAEVVAAAARGDARHGPATWTCG